MSSVVKPQYGPTLSELAGPRLRALPRWARVALAAAALMLVALLIWARFLKDDGREAVVVREPIAFNLLYGRDKLVRAAPRQGESLRLVTPANDPDPESVTIRPVVLQAYEGDINGVLPTYATELIRAMRAADPQFILREEGRDRVNRQPGYKISFQTRQGGRTVYGRRSLLFADEPGLREGADVTLLAVRSPSMPNVDAVGSNGPTKLPYRSFRFGTDRP